MRMEKDGRQNNKKKNNEDDEEDEEQRGCLMGEELKVLKRSPSTTTTDDSSSIASSSEASLCHERIPRRSQEDEIEGGVSCRTLSTTEILIRGESNRGDWLQQEQRRDDDGEEEEGVAVDCVMQEGNTRRRDTTTTTSASSRHQHQKHHRHHRWSKRSDVTMSSSESNEQHQHPPWRAAHSMEIECPENGSPQKLRHHDESQDPFILFGFDLSHLPPSVQFIICASGVFCFTIVYGYLQELLSVHIAGRKYAFFLAVCQFTGYAFWSLVLTLIKSTRQTKQPHNNNTTTNNNNTVQSTLSSQMCPPSSPSSVPWSLYLVLSILRAADLGMTNLSMQFLNYPAKTLIKSSRVVFTMMLGLLIRSNRYRSTDFLAVALLVCGLAIFLHADSRSEAVFHPFGVMLLVLSLTCDGTVSNWSELIMTKYSVHHDQFQFHLYSISLCAMILAAHCRNELIPGLHNFFLHDGTIAEIESGDAESVWTVPRKIFTLVLFCTTGLFGSSCAAAITKRFGALSMSITSTARKGMTLFLSFVLFPKVCTLEHIVGMVVFLGALLYKSFARSSWHEVSGWCYSIMEEQTEEDEEEEDGWNIQKRSLLGQMTPQQQQQRQNDGWIRSIELSPTIP